MSYGLLTAEMETAIEPFVRDTEVWDLGAGDLQYAHKLLDLGARVVHAVDKEYRFGEPTPALPRIKIKAPPGVAIKTRPHMKIVPAYFHEIEVPKNGIPTAFLSWPPNWHTPGLRGLLAAAKTVIYLGCNTGGSACGTRDLFDPLSQRKVLAHVPHSRNSLIVYGEHVGRRPLVGDEVAVFGGSEISFEAAEKIAAKVTTVVREVQENDP